MTETPAPLPLAEDTPLCHRARQHAACHTNEYLYHQLIPYIGNKRKLLPFLAEAFAQTGIARGTFADFFAGSGVVSRLAKRLGYRVLANDWEPYACALNTAYVGCNHPPAFERLGGVTAVFRRLNALPPLDGYITEHYCPVDDAHPDLRHERLFFTRKNGRKIDAMREQIAAWESEGLLDAQEKAFLLAPLVYAVSYVSNTSGLFKGFHRGWGGATGTALYRILSDIHLALPLTLDNGQENRVFREDAASLARHIACDIAYLDPPYNQHPYGSNYHLLNTVVLWDKPPLAPRITAHGDKSGIRTDWRSQRRSAYNYRGQAVEALAALVETLDARRIVMSYGSEGLIPVEQVMQVLGSRGALRVLCRPYKRYRVSSQRYSPRAYTVEYAVIVNCEKQRGGVSPERAAKRILAAEKAVRRTQEEEERERGEEPREELA
ncbi:MAG TPA: DNA adenine methylase [Armatimonadota bacterium]|nr:DNA adenine methylase [Armatimonadota bacterium]